MLSKRNSKLLRAAAAAAPVVCVIAGNLAIGTRAQAASFVYTPSNATDLWSTGAGWSSTPTSGIDTVLTFVGDNTSVLASSLIDTSVNDIASFQLNQIDLQGTGPAAAPASTINITGNALTLTNNGTSDPTINLNAINGSGLTYNVTTAFSLANTVTFQGSGSAVFNFLGNITGAGGLIKANGSTLILQGNNSYGGNTTINGGTLRAVKPGALSGFTNASSIVVNAGTVSVVGGGSLGWSSSQIDTLKSNAVFNAGAALAIHVDPANSFTYATNIADSGNTLGFAKSGGGVLTLTGNNTYLGNTTLSAGQLNVNSATAIGAGALVYVNANTLLDNTSGAGITLTNNNAITLNNNLGFIGSNDLSFGTGTVTFTAGRTITVRSHTLTVGAINGSGQTLTKQGGGTLSIPSSANTWGDGTYTGGVLALGTQGSMGSGNIVMANGEINIQGSSSGPRNVTSGAATLSTGRNTFTLTADPSQPITYTMSSLSTRFLAGSTVGTVAYGTTLYRGTNLGGTPGNGVANIFFSSAPTPSNVLSGTVSFAALGSGALNTDEAAVLRGALYDSSPTGNGKAFATYDPAVGVRALKTSEQNPAMVANKNVRLTLAAGTNSYTGAIVNTLQLDNTTGNLAVATFNGAAAAFQPVHGLLFSGNSPITMTGSAALTFGTGASQIDGLIYSIDTAPVILGSGVAAAGSGNHGLTFAGPGDITVNGNITGLSSQGGIAINGPGTVTINGATALSSNGLDVNGGTLKFGPNFTFNGTASSRNFQIASGATVDMNGVTVGNAHGLQDFNGAGGVLTNTGAAAVLTFSHASDVGSSRTFSGLITGNLGLAWNTAANVTGTQTLANQNTYTGSTNIASGTVILGVTNALPTTTALTITGGGTNPSALELQGFNQTVDSLNTATLTSSGQIIQNSAPNTTSIFTIAGTGVGTYTGLIADNSGVGGVVGLVRSGSGTFNLNGSGTYTGGTTINGGTMRVNGALTKPSNAVAVNAGTLGGSGSIAGPVTVASGAHVAPGSSVGTLTINNTFSLASGSNLDYELIAPGNNDVVDASAVNNGFTLNGGVFNLLQNNAPDAFSDPGTYNLIKFQGSIQGTGLDSSWTTNSLTNPHVLNPQVFKSYAFGNAGGFLTLTITSTTTTATWSGTAGSNWGTAGAGGNWSNGVAPGAPGDTAIFPGNATSFTVNLNNAGATDRTVGAITFNSATPYTINQGSGGTLFLDESTAAAVINDALGNHTIAAPMSLSSNTNVSVVNAGDTLTISGNIAGVGTLTKTGNGTLALTGNNTHNGTVISAGTVLINADANLGTNAVTINTAALATSTSLTSPRTIRVGSASSTIDVEGAATAYQLDGLLTDATSPGTLIKTGPGTLVMNGSANNTGGVTVTAGTLQIGNGGATGTLGAVPLNIGAAAVVTTNRPGTTTIGGNITGTGSLVPSAGTTLSLSGSNTGYTGLISITNGTLNLASTPSLGASLVLNNATLTHSTAAAINDGAASVTFASATIVGAATINTTGTTLTVSAQLMGSGNITRTGTGTLSLGLPGNTAFSNSFYGGTFVNTSGALDFNSRLAGSRNARWIFSGGTITISQPSGGSTEYGYIEGSLPLTVTGSSARLRIGDLGGTDTFAGAISGGSVGLAKFGPGTLILSAQNTFRNDGVTFTTGSGSNAGGYTVVVSSGTLGAASSTADTITGPFGGIPTYNTNAGTLNGTLVGGSAVLIGVGGTGSFSDAALVTSGPFNVANDITVSGGGEASLQTTPYTLTLGGTTDNNSTFSGKVLLQNNLTVSQSATTGNHALNLTGGMFGVLATIGPNDTTIPAADNTGFQTVTFAGAGSVNVTGMIANVDPNPTNYLGLAFAGLGGVVSVVNTSGTTSLTGNNNYSGTTTVAGGTLILGKNAQAEVLTGPGGIVNAGLLALDYSGGGTNPSGTVKTILSAGYAGGFQSGQIRTANAVDATKAIGWRDDSANSQVLIKYTWEGDANVDGVVNALDFNALATNFGASNPVWAQGDFNYNGTVDTSDFTMLSQNFNKAAVAAPPLSPALGALVPEPATLGLIGLGVALTLRRRRPLKRATT